MYRVRRQSLGLVINKVCTKGNTQRGIKMQTNLGIGRLIHLPDFALLRIGAVGKLVAPGGLVSSAATSSTAPVLGNQHNNKSRV